MEYVEIELLKQSEKSVVHLVREKEGEQRFIRKRLRGRHEIYPMLQDCPHPGLPQLYQVELSDDETTVIEEYIEGQPAGSVELSEPQLLCVVRELCDVLEALHDRGIIHRDLKPSNIILAQDGHIRLIDFDAARVPKNGKETDTRLLGTRGYASPEQYGFAQTDVRTDIYSLGVTLEQIFGDKAEKPRYRRIIQKCRRLDPDKRYQSVQQVKRAFFPHKRNVVCGILAALFLLTVCLWYLSGGQSGFVGHNGLAVLPAPEDPRWNGETGIALWENVPDSGSGGVPGYVWRLYWNDTAIQPDLNKDQFVIEGGMRGKQGHNEENFTYDVSLSEYFQKNGFYYFAVCSVGDGKQYTDSPFVLSDVFEFTGESAPVLPAPSGLKWMKENSGSGIVSNYAVWSNLDDYEDADSFNVRVYNAAGDFVGNNIWSKKDIISMGKNGIWIDPQLLEEEGGPYRFTVQVYSSRPNEFQSSYGLPDPIPEEAFSPWNDQE